MLWETSLSPAALLSLVLCVGLWLIFFARALKSDRTGKKPAANSAAAVAADAASLAHAQAQQLQQQQQQLYTLIAPAVRERIGLLDEDAFVPSEAAVATAPTPVTQPLCDARGVNELALGWSTAPRIVCNLPSAPIRAKRFNTWTLFGRSGECVRLKIADLGGGLCFAEIGVAFAAAPTPRASSSSSSSTPHLSAPGPVVHHHEYVAFGGLLGSGGAAAALPDTPLAAFAYDSGRVQLRCTRTRSSYSTASNSPNSGGSGGTDADDDMTLSFRVKDCSSLTGAVGTGGVSLLEGCVTVHWPVAHQVRGCCQMRGCQIRVFFNCSA